MAIVVLGFEHPAKDALCAGPVWMWLYCLLALMIPAVLGCIITAVKGLLHVREQDSLVPQVYFTIAHTSNVVVFMIVGVVLMSDLSDNKFCQSFYVETHIHLYVVFIIQVLLFTTATMVSVPLTIFQLYSFCCAPERDDYEDLKSLRPSSVNKGDGRCRSPSSCAPFTL
eukprot:3312493-Rhodomonas_salina.3